VGGRYAQALFDLATEDKNLAAVEADLKALKTMRADSKDFRTLLASPAFSADEKSRAIAALATKGKFNNTTKKFLGLLAANGRCRRRSRPSRPSRPRAAASSRPPSPPRSP